MVLENWIGWYKSRIITDKTSEFYLRQALSGYAEYWQHRCLLAENVINKSTLTLNDEVEMASLMLVHHIENEGLNPTNELEKTLKKLKTKPCIIKGVV